MVRLFYTEVKQSDRQTQARHLHDAAHEMLHRCVLSCMTGITGKPALAVRLELSYGEHGKPYLKSHPAFNVSLSHAGDIAMCAISEQEIGVDVQDHRAISDERMISLAARFYAPEEQQFLEEAPSFDVRQERFFRIWAAKEAYAKYTGKGLAEDFTRFYADFEGMRIRESGNMNSNVFAYLCEPLSLDAYSCMLCSEEPVARENGCITIRSDFVPRS